MRKLIFGLFILLTTAFVAFSCMDDVKGMFEKWKEH